MFRVFQPQREILPTVPPQSALSLHPTSLNLGHPVSRGTPKSYLKLAPVRQMRHKAATKFFDAATDRVSLNAPIVSGGATPPRPQ